jgi:hypothetical protein
LKSEVTRRTQTETIAQLLSLDYRAKGLNFFVRRIFHEYLMNGRSSASRSTKDFTTGTTSTIPVSMGLKLKKVTGARKYFSKPFVLYESRAPRKILIL